MLHYCPVAVQNRNIAICSHSGARIGARKFAKRKQPEHVASQDGYKRVAETHILIAPSPLPLPLPMTAQYTGNVVLILGLVMICFGMLQDRDHRP